MEEKNKVFTEDNIMKALLKMTPENKNALLTFNFETLRWIANDTVSAQSAIEGCDKHITGWHRTKDAILEFLDIIHGESTEYDQ